MPLTTTGWDPTTFPEIRAGVVALWKLAFGDNADTDPNTPDGLLINIIAMSVSLAFDVNTQLWANSFFRSATGISLDRILDLFAKEREPAERSTVTAIWYGAPATAIPGSAVAITADQAANRFGPDAASSIGADDNSLTWVVRILAAELELYTVQVNAEIPSDYTGLFGDTVVDVATGLRDDINSDGFATARLAGVDASGNALLALDIVGGAGNIIVFSASPNTVIDALEAVRTPATALEDGSLIAAAGTLLNIGTPIGGVVGVTNDEDGTIGQSEESADAFRARHLQTLFANSSRTDGGMQASVAKVSGVIENSVVSNRFVDPFDGDGRPIGSGENIILTDGTALDLDIANAIALQIPAGIEPFGSKDYGVGTTPDGEIVQIFATPAEELFLHLEITITMGEDFPTGDIAQAVATAIASYFDAGIVQTSAGVFTEVSAKLVTGKDWTRFATCTPINIVTQTSTTNTAILSAVTPLPGDQPIFAAADRPATDRQIIRVDASRIAVAIL